MSLKQNVYKPARHKIGDIVVLKVNSWSRSYDRNHKECPFNDYHYDDCKRGGFYQAVVIAAFSTNNISSKWEYICAVRSGGIEEKHLTVAEGKIKDNLTNNPHTPEMVYK